jgi:hypothetical protein
MGPVENIVIVNKELSMNRSAGLRPGSLVSDRRIEPGRRPALPARGSWPVSRSKWNKGLSMNPWRW